MDTALLSTVSGFEFNNKNRSTVCGDQSAVQVDEIVCNKHSEQQHNQYSAKDERLVEVLF